MTADCHEPRPVAQLPRPAGAPGPERSGHPQLLSPSSLAPLLLVPAPPLRCCHSSPLASRRDKPHGFDSGWFEHLLLLRFDIDLPAQPGASAAAISRCCLRAVCLAMLQEHRHRRGGLVRLVWHAPAAAQWPPRQPFIQPTRSWLDSTRCGACIDSYREQEKEQRERLG